MADTNNTRTIPAVSGDLTAFMPALSQELRTPLTATLGFAELLSDPRSGPLNSYQRKAMDAIFRTTEHLITMVDVLMPPSNPETRQPVVTMGDLDLVRLVHTAADDYQADARDRWIGICHEPGDGPLLYGEERLLRQAMANLLDNALKFTRSRGHVTVSTEFGRHGWAVEVRDSGIGISARHLAAVTNDLRLTSGSKLRRVPGAGTGLLATQEIVDLHQGTLDIESALNTGTTVRIVLPVLGRSR